MSVRTVDVEPNLIQLLAVIGLSIGAGLALPAPQHFLRGDRLAAHEGLVGALIAGFLPGFHHNTGKFMSQDAGETGQARVKDVAILFLLGHMNIRSTDAAGFDLDHHFLGSRSRNVIFADLKARVAPNLAAKIGLSTFDIFPAKLETGLGIPISDQGDPWHGFHDVFSFFFKHKGHEAAPRF